jgi:tetratricopeptide (TPR) repeat protein
MKLLITKANSYVFGVLMFLFTSFCNFYADGSSFIKHPFDTINRVKKEYRVDVATSFYKNNYRHIDEKLAMTYLDQLTAMAHQYDDKVLESLVFDLKADYYAINRKFNNLSINYYNKAANFAKENNLTLQTAIYLHHAGMFYSNFKHNTKACIYFLKAQEEFKKVGFENVPNMAGYYAQVADFYYHLGDYTNAKLQLYEALKYDISNAREKVSIINTLGLICRNSNQYPQALNNFNKAFNIALTSRDTVWMGILKGNIGSIYFLQGDYNKALPYIQTDYAQSLKYGEKINAAIALLRLVKIDLANKEIAHGLKQLANADTLIHNNPVYVLNLRANILDLKAQFYEEMGLTAKALNYKKMYELANDSLVAQNNIAAVEVVKMQYVISKQQAEENRLITQANIKATQRNTVFMVFCLLLIISILLYSRQALKIKKDKQLLLSEKRRVDDELKYTEMKLKAYTENFRKNNDLIDTFKEQIEFLKNKNADSAVVNHLEELMQAHIMTDDSWTEFKKIFLKVYPNFFFGIKNTFSHLSETDIRLLTLIKLQSSNKEMANMLGVTVEGVKKAKQRLRKKMNLDEQVGIEDAISQF